MRNRTSWIAVSAAALVTVALTGCGTVLNNSADEEDFPSDTITLTVGQGAGGSTDLIAREIARGTSGALGVPVNVENSPGANGAIATLNVMQQEATGYELVLLNASLLTVTPLVVSEDEEVSLDDLDVIMGLSQDDYIMVADSNSDYSTFDELVASGDRVSTATPGIGTAGQLAQTLVTSEAGVDVNDIPYDSGGPAITAVMGGHVDLATVQVGEAMPQIEAGTVEPLLVFSDDRNEFLPDVPTAAEEGYTVPVAQYRAVAAPEGTPESVQQELRAAIEETLETEEYREFNENNYLTPVEISGDEVEEQWNEMAALYEELVEQNEIHLGGDRE